MGHRAKRGRRHNDEKVGKSDEVTNNAAAEGAAALGIRHRPILTFRLADSYRHLINPWSCRNTPKILSTTKRPYPLRMKSRAPLQNRRPTWHKRVRPASCRF